MSTRLRDYQRAGVRAIRDRFDGRALLADDLGLGKTLQALYYAAKYLPDNPPGPIVCVVPANLRTNWKREAAKHLGIRVEVLYGQAVPRDQMEPLNPNQVFVIGYDTLQQPKRDGERRNPARDWTTWLRKLEPRIIIADECFPASSLVNTNKGPLTIGEIVNNQLPLTIQSWDHKSSKLVLRPIVQYVKKLRDTRMVRIHHEHGSVDCTENHEIWTEDAGYVRAIELVGGSRMRILPNSVPRTSVLQTEVLQSQMRDGAPRPEKTRPTESGGGRVDDCEQSLTKSGVGQKIKRNEGKEGHPSHLAGRTGRQRQKIETRTGTRGMPRSRVDCATLRKDQEALAVSGALQNRHGTSEIEDGCGDRRPLPRQGTSFVEGQEKGSSTQISRVDRVEILEQGRGRTCDVGSADDPFVYCLEIAETHNFFADGVLVHNCQYIKNAEAARARAFKRLCKGVPRLIGLSATPLTNSPKDLYSFLSIMKPEVFNSKTEFYTRYTIPELRPWGWQYKGARNLPELHALLRKHGMIRRLKSDVLKELPTVTVSVVPLEIDRREYEEAEDNYLGWLASLDAGAARRQAGAEELNRIMGLRRLAGRLKTDAAVRWVRDYFDNTGEKLLLGAIHKAVTGPLMEAFEKTAVLLDGSLSDREKTVAQDRFNMDPRVRLMVANLNAGGVGWSCKSTSMIAVLEMPWTPGELNQFVGRIHGLERGLPGVAAMAWILVAEDTVEDDLCRLYMTKQEWLDTALDGRTGVGGLELLNRERLDNVRGRIQKRQARRRAKR